MKTRRDLIVIALATFCLTATVFMVFPTRSADDPNWDPWADIKEDGTIDIFDAIKLSNAFDSSGDTTKNVNVTNWPSSLNIGIQALNVSLGSGIVPPDGMWLSDSAIVDCYREYYMYVSYDGPASLSIDVRFITCGIEVTAQSFSAITQPTLAGPYAIKGTVMRSAVHQSPIGLEDDFVTITIYAYNP
jgi:hypothetical protein